jgi:peptidoglycan hydrolase-like protein with peptidoglycan-binding domain
MGKRAVVSWVTVGAVAVGGGAAGWWWRAHPAAPAPAAASVPTGTASVTKTDLSTTTQVDGALGYSGDYSVVAQGRGGTVTALPQPGQVITRGQPVFELDNQPIRLFYGDRPAWRPLASGVTDGPDVRVLESNLNALGYRLTPDNHFGSATASALRRWQRTTHQTVTGRLGLGAVTVQPGPIRVTAVPARLGTNAGGDQPMLTATSTTVGVTIAVPVSQTYLVHLRDAVTVTMPDGKTATGKVTQLSVVATQAPQDNGRQSQPTVAGVVTLDRPDAGSGLDQAPVQVNIVSQSVHAVLTVPITALVALAGGGYGVYLLSGGSRRLVGVTPGVFADTLVEIKNTEVHEGDVVEVPAP